MAEVACLARLQSYGTGMKTDMVAGFLAVNSISNYDNIYAQEGL